LAYPPECRCPDTQVATVSNWAASRSDTGRGIFKLYHVGSPVFSMHNNNIASRQLSRISSLGASAPTRSNNLEKLNSTKSGEMKLKSRLHRRVRFAFGPAVLTLMVTDAVSYRGFRVSHCAAHRRLDV
jgi:hypothetical protein